MPHPSANTNPPPPPRRNTRPLVTCPQCEHQQTERQFCKRCGVNMSSYRIDQAIADAQQRVERGWFWQAEPAQLFSLNPAGRMGRKAFLISLIWGVCLCLAGVLFNRWLHYPLALYGMLGLASVYVIRCQTVRLHDLGYSGLWQFLPGVLPLALHFSGGITKLLPSTLPPMLVKFVANYGQWLGSSFSLVLLLILLIFPAQRKDNKFGLFSIGSTKGLKISIVLAIALAWLL